MGASVHPQAQQIRLVLDNLNTHTTSAFYEALPADEAFALAQRFAFVYTPKAASWLNLIELEFSALARLCLDRRIPTLAKLEAEVLALVAERDRKRIKIDWQFSIQTARAKFNTHYCQLHPATEKFLKT